MILPHHHASSATTILLVRAAHSTALDAKRDNRPALDLPTILLHNCTTEILLNH